MKTLIISLLLAVALGCGAAKAQEPVRPVLSAYTIEAGSAHVAQTYLSPLRHSGWDLALSYERMQAMRFNPDDFVMRLSGRLSGARTTNIPARNALLWKLNLALDWSMMWRRSFGAWSIYAGGYTGIDGGALYLPRNGNNPVAAQASWTVGIAASAVWRTRFGSVPLYLRYLGQMPLTGMFFSPEYGELYYEIYLGNHHGLLRGAWPGNFFRLDNLLTADFRFGGTTLRVGYRCRVASTKASHIVSRDIEHMAVLGVVSEWISLSPKKSIEPEARYISAMY